MSPNSFYNPSQSLDDALRLAEQMQCDGADIVDIGGEATNPFVDIEKESPDCQQEIDRVAPLIEAIKQRMDVAVSVDTSQPKVMQAAITAGVDMVNDQRALRIPNALEVVASSKVDVCLMYFPIPSREPGCNSPAEHLHEIKSGLLQAAQRCEQAGIAKQRIVLDPGFGQGNFGKNCDENFYILANLHELTELGYPILSGWSRKSMIGDVLGVPADQRLHGSVAAAVLSLMQGASILRVHDVKPTVDALRMYEAFALAQ